MKKYFFLISFFAALVLSSSANAQALPAGALPIKRFAWSSNIGWISFSCLDMGTCGTSNYQVRLNPDMTIGGYAWSSGVGWISFEASDVASCPTAPCTARIATTTKNGMTAGQVTGFARVLAASTTALGAYGWDGWIQLSGTNHPSPGTVAQGVSLDTTTPASQYRSLRGYAWGGPVVGWISFNTALSPQLDPDPNTPSACVINTFIATGTSSPIIQNNRATISWSATNAVSCTSTSGNFNTSNLTSGSVQSNSLTTLGINTFSIQCQNAAASTCINQTSVEVSVPTQISEAYGSCNELTSPVFRVSTTTAVAGYTFGTKPPAEGVVLDYSYVPTLGTNSTWCEYTCSATYEAIGRKANQKRCVTTQSFGEQ